MAVRTAVKTKLSYRMMDTIEVLFFPTNKNKDNANVSLASYNTNFTREFWAQFGEQQQILFEINSTIYE